VKVTTLETLAEIDRDIINATDSAVVMQNICRYTATHLGAQQSAVLVVGASNELQCVGHTGLIAPALLCAELTSAPRDRPAFIRQTYPQADTSRETLLAELCSRENIGAYAFAPLRTNSHTLGILWVAAAAPRVWNDETLSTLELLAGQTALA